MPEDYYIEAKNVVEGTRWYGKKCTEMSFRKPFLRECYLECKNGHPYLVLKVSDMKY